MHPADQPFGPDPEARLGPMLQGAYAPVFDEVTLDGLEVIGELPQDLSGVYLRNGPNPRHAPQGRYHWFDGDGMVHAAHFDRGRVTYRNRWLRTPKFAHEAAAGNAQFMGIMETLKGRQDRPLMDTANTDIIGHGGQALAFWYMCGQAMALDPVTLETRGAAGFTQAFQGEISAHPKVDPVSGELLFFDYFDHAPFMRYGVVDKAGKLTHQADIRLPGTRLPHDMAFTERYTILHDLPLFHDPEALAMGRHKLSFYPDIPARFGILPRYGRARDVRWFEAEPCFIYHVANAWDEGDEVVMVGCRYVVPRDARGAMDAVTMAKMIAQLQMDARLHRWRFNLATGQTKEETLDPDHNVEFCTSDQRLHGRKSRYAYQMLQTKEVPHFVGIGRHDCETGQLESYAPGPQYFYSEAPFAPRGGAPRIRAPRDSQARDGALRDRATSLAPSHAELAAPSSTLPRDESDGYCVSFVWDAEARRSEIQVFDAASISKGPVARVIVPRKIPTGFHATWIPAADLVTPQAA
jgi:carotenoid cleavage dioxygenase-like enzyme